METIENTVKHLDNSLAYYVKSNRGIAEGLAIAIKFLSDSIRKEKYIDSEKHKQ